MSRRIVVFGRPQVAAFVVILCGGLGVVMAASALRVHFTNAIDQNVLFFLWPSSIVMFAFGGFAYRASRVVCTPTGIRTFQRPPRRIGWDEIVRFEPSSSPLFGRKDVVCAVLTDGEAVPLFAVPVLVVHGLFYRKGDQEQYVEDAISRLETAMAQLVA